MSEKPELLPCPFCGSKADYELDSQWQDKYVVECEYCGCSRRSEYGWESVANEWNERYMPPGCKLVPVEHKEDGCISAPGYIRFQEEF